MLKETGVSKNSVPLIDFSNKRILYLTKNPELIKNQLAGEDIGPVNTGELLDRVSTDAYPTRACFRYDREYLANQALTGISLGNDEWIPENAIRQGNFGIIVAGSSFGCGSSREHFPMSLLAAGVQLIVAKSVEHIFAQNCQNIGLPYLQGEQMELINKIITEKKLYLSKITQNLDPISATIITAGGLFPYFRHYQNSALPKPETQSRPMTGSEKIIAKHMGTNFVKPGDIGFVETDRRYSHEIFFPFSYHILKQEAPKARISQRESIYLFNDHSTIDDSPDALSLAKQMRTIAQDEDLLLYDGNKTEGVEGICHTIMLDRHVLPGEVVAGTDSHTCTIGALGAFPIGVGSTEWAGCLWTNKVRLTVPSSLHFRLTGSLSRGVMAKDIMLYILSLPDIKRGEGIGKVFEFSGETLNHLLFDEQVVLSNMSVECGASASFIEPNQKTIEFLRQHRQLSNKQLAKMLYYSDENAEYASIFDIDTSLLEPFIALPGSPQNSISLSALIENSSINKNIQKAFIGSCTGGKYEDILRAAAVLEKRKVHPDVKLYVQPNSQSVLTRIYKEGLVKIITEAGGIILPPACGACVNFGPGSVKKNEQGISSTNRNFPGRMGEGLVFLANPEVVAASAITGYITSPNNL